MFEIIVFIALVLAIVIAIILVLAMTKPDAFRVERAAGDVLQLLDEPAVAVAGGDALILGARERVRAAVTLALREQDRATRHACAEAVTSSIPDSPSVAVVDAITRAHQACMNAYGV